MTAVRRTLNFGSEADVIAEVRRLAAAGGGCARAGNWSLIQVCSHLDKAMRYRMQPGPFPPNTAEQDARQGVLREVLSSGRLPEGIVAPEPLLPAPDAGDEAVDSLIDTLAEFARFPGPYAPHRVFGNLANEDSRKLNLIHCAHHLAYLSPKS